MQTQTQTVVPYTLAVKWVKTTPHGAVAPTWAGYFKAERIAFLAYLPVKRHGFSWMLHYDGRLAKRLGHTDDLLWIYVPTMTLAKQRVTALVTLLPN